MIYDCLDTSKIVGFDWDDGNILKNKIKHNLKWQTIEEVFFNSPLLIMEDFKHSKEKECRCVALGHIDNGRLITVIFTKRKNTIRVISARSMSKKEIKFYENNTKV